MQQIDHIQYGRLLASVDHLTAQLQATTTQLSTLSSRLEQVEGRFKVGKGALIGIVFAAGALGMGFKEFISAFFGGRG